jgi:quercetin dioxygenase-like cupin family protein
LRDYSVEEMARRAVTGEQRRWSSDALLDAVLPGHGGEMAPVIGYGISQDRHSTPPIVNPHGFSVEWLRLAAAHQVGRHLCESVQVLMVFKGTLEVTYNQQGEEVTIVATERSVVSVPAGCWRSYRALDADMEATLTTQRDQRKRLYWDETLLEDVRKLNRCLDPDGYVTKANILPSTARRAGEKIERLPGITL